MALIDLPQIEATLAESWLQCHRGVLLEHCERLLAQRVHGDLQHWLDTINALPRVEAVTVSLDCPAVSVGAGSTISEGIRSRIENGMMQLHPWRKGPFDLFGVCIDSEWRSDWKWQRIQPHLSSLQERTVLDVGCGNGYYLYRMLGAGAELAIGIDPTQLFVAQFRALNSYFSQRRAFILPMKSEDFLDRVELDGKQGFDTVFSMGVYYHRREPLEHIRELLACLRPGGELVLETLVIAGKSVEELIPRPRYAQMRNVWSLPSVAKLQRDLQQTGLVDIRLVDLTATGVDEQRATRWMKFESLENFLDPADPVLTVEGYPAPLRACMIAARPEH